MIIKKALDDSRNLIDCFETNAAYSWGKSDAVVGVLIQMRADFVDSQTPFCVDFCLQEPAEMRKQLDGNYFHNELTKVLAYKATAELLLKEVTTTMSMHYTKTRK